jgi:excisionase family DNA binding protein
MYDTRNDRMLTVEDMAEFLSMPISVVREKCRKRSLPAVRMGKAYRCAESDLSNYIESLKAQQRAA